ncbi:MAG: HD domain-containing phosphohydrolase [Candidatus Pacearchaeota archaeon]
MTYFKPSHNKDLVEIIQEKEDSLGNKLARREIEESLVQLSILKYDTIEKIEIRNGHDPFLHGEQISKYVYAIGIKLNIPYDELDMICFAASLHDIGKIKIPEEILDKPGPLTSDERKVIELHPVYGKEMTSPFIYIGDLILYHHERPDGKGYPLGLMSDKIPLGSKIISVIDAYNAITHWRPYKPAYSKEKALVELIKGRDTQFDSQIVDVFIKLINNSWFT